jgi:NAD(P)-dependent dehydrogenase (short-subunit alcohol dehydrogenase family)
VALITAGSAGLGAATARLFASNGMRVVINYSSNSERAETMVKDLEMLSPLSSNGASKNFFSVKADLAKRDDIIRLVDESVAAMGQLDVVFSNVGWTQIRNIMDLDDNMNEDDWDHCYQMNVKSHLFLMHASRKYLEDTGGAFITTASLAGVKPSGSSLAYSVTKAAQIHLVKGLAMIAAPKIRVNTVAPGLLLTDWGRQFSKEKQDAALARTKLKRFATVEDVAAQVLCFAQQKSVTGAVAVIDAGLSI